MTDKPDLDVLILNDLYDWLFRNFGVGPMKDIRGVAVPFETLEKKLRAMLADRGVTR